MVYVRRVVGSLLIVFGLTFIVQIVKKWDRLSRSGASVARIDAEILIAFVGMGLALLWPIRQAQPAGSKRLLRDVPAIVVLRRMVTALCVAGIFAFALRVPRDWNRMSKTHHRVAWADIGVVLVCGTWIFVAMMPPPRRNPLGDATSS
jgi:O-antigen ligase